MYKAVCFPSLVILTSCWKGSLNALFSRTQLIIPHMGHFELAFVLLLGEYVDLLCSWVWILL